MVMHNVRAEPKPSRTCSWAGGACALELTWWGCTPGLAPDRRFVAGHDMCVAPHLQGCVVRSLDCLNHGSFLDEVDQPLALAMRVSPEVHLHRRKAGSWIHIAAADCDIGWIHVQPNQRQTPGRESQGGESG